MTTFVTIVLDYLMHYLKTDVIDLVRGFNDDIGDATINVAFLRFFVQMRYPVYTWQNLIVSD